MYNFKKERKRGRVRGGGVSSKKYVYIYTIMILL